MPSSINLDNGIQRFNIHLSAAGNLQFKANRTDGDGPTRMLISDNSGEIFIGGDEANGRVRILDQNGTTTIVMEGSGGDITLGTPNNDGDLSIFSGNNNLPISIQLNGANGRVTCIELQETSDLLLKEDISPLQGALDQVLAMRGVLYRWKQGDSPERALGSGLQIGLIGQEVEAICPEIVATNSEGYKTLNYSRLTALLIEAVKEQQQTIKQQEWAFREVLARIEQLETSVRGDMSSDSES